MAPSLNQRRSRRQEKKAAEELGGHLTPGSGARPFAKGDVQVGKELKVECKVTSGDSYSLKRKDLANLRESAIREGGVDFAFQVQFRTGPAHSSKYAIIDWQTYLDLRADAAELADMKSRLEKGAP